MEQQQLVMEDFDLQTERRVNVGFFADFPLFSLILRISVIMIDFHKNDD